ncbi:MAG: hypothetical protein ACK5HS_01505 [Mycoplasmatales bacterium]
MKKFLLLINIIILFIISFIFAVYLCNLPQKNIDQGKTYELSFNKKENVSSELSNLANDNNVLLSFYTIDKKYNKQYYVSNINKYEQNNFININTKNKLVSIPDFFGKTYIYQFDKLDLDSVSKLIIHTNGQSKNIKSFESSLVNNNYQFEELSNGHASMGILVFYIILFYVIFLYLLVYIAILTRKKKNIVIENLLEFNFYKGIINQFYKINKSLIICLIFIFIFEVILSIIFNLIWMINVVYIQIIVSILLIIIQLIITYIIYFTTTRSKQKIDIIKGNYKNIALMLSINLIKILTIFVCIVSSSIIINNIIQSNELKDQISYVNNFDQYASTRINLSKKSSFQFDEDEMRRRVEELYNITKDELDVITFEIMFNQYNQPENVITNTNYLKMLDLDISSGTYKKGMANILIPESKKSQEQDIKSYIQDNYFNIEPDKYVPNPVMFPGDESNINLIYYSGNPFFYTFDPLYNTGSNALTNPIVLISDDLLNYGTSTIYGGDYYFKFHGEDPYQTLKPFVSKSNADDFILNATKVTTNFQEQVNRINFSIIINSLNLLIQLLILIAMTIITLNTYLLTNIKKFAVRRLYSQDLLSPYSSLLVLMLSEYLFIFIISFIFIHSIAWIIFILIVIDFIVLYVYNKNIKKEIIFKLKGDI